MTWVLSATSLIVLWLMGNKSKWANRLGLLNQVLWTVYAVSTKQYGLIPGVLAYSIIYVINIWKWEKNNVANLRKV